MSTSVVHHLKDKWPSSVLCLATNKRRWSSWTRAGGLLSRVQVLPTPSLWMSATKQRTGGWVIPGSQALDDITEIATWESKRAVSHWASFLASPGLSLLICNRGDNNSSYVELWKLNEFVSKVLGTMPVSRLPEARMWNMPAWQPISNTLSIKTEPLGSLFASKFYSLLYPGLSTKTHEQEKEEDQTWHDWLHKRSPWQESTGAEQAVKDRTLWAAFACRVTHS